MSTLSESPWELVRELGLELRPAGGQDRGAELFCPIVADWIPQAGYLIVDDAVTDSFPLQRQCRTLLVSHERETIYDSSKTGIEDGYGFVTRGLREKIASDARNGCAEVLAVPTLY